MNWPIGPVYLNVAQLRPMLSFYTTTIGLQLLSQNEATATLGVPGSTEPILHLTERPDGQPSSGGTGLYHFAILVPSRLELAKVLYQFAARQVALQGLSDHFVSEAIYLADPEGNGIEIYRDRPRSEWNFDQGQLQMGTVALDARGVLAELGDHPGEWSGLPAGTLMGHIHLHVASVPAAEAFYQGLLGLAVMVRYGPTASFLSYEGYHHHLGVNIWRRGAPSPVTPSTLGLRWYTLRYPDSSTLDTITTRLESAGVPLEPHSDGVLIRDPVQNGILLQVATQTHSHDS